MKFKKILSILLILILSFSSLSLAYATDEKSNIINVYTSDDLNKIRENLTGSYILMNDIDLSNEEWIPIGTEQAPFKGQFNGNNYSITGLKINSIVECAYKSSTGLFAFATGATIKNLSVNADIQVSESKDSFYSVGIIVGYAKFSKIENCITSGSIKADLGGTCCAGGIVGEVIHDSNISNCENTANLYANAKSELYIGGIVGSSYSPVSLCANKGNLDVENSKSEEPLNDAIYVGGIIGSMFMATIDNCYNIGDIRMGVMSNSAQVGGIGGMTFSVSDCYNTGEISYTNQSATEYTAGIAGRVVYFFNGMGTGEAVHSKVSNCYCLNNTSKVLGNTDSSKVKNTAILTEEEMKDKSNYVGFDFKNVWKMGENGYPVFGAEPDSPDDVIDIIDMEIAYLPIKNRIVFNNGLPAVPSGIVIELTYSDGSIENVTVEQGEDGDYYIDDQRVLCDVDSSNFNYGILSTDLILENHDLMVEYWYLSIPSLSAILNTIMSK